MNRRPLHPNCRCVLIQREPTPAELAFLEAGRKAIAKILLSNAGRRTVVVPTAEEWIGINLLERDDGLPPRREIKL